MKLPIQVSEKSRNLFAKMYRKLGELAKYVIYRVFPEENFLSYSHDISICPGNRKVYSKFRTTETYKKIKQKSVKLMGSGLAKVYEDPYADIARKTQTLRYGIYYGILPFPGIINYEDLSHLDKGYRYRELTKGYFLPTIVKRSCHNIFSQILNLFDYALARDQLKEGKFAKIALNFHHTFALRDAAYIPRYKWLLSNPKLATNLQTVMFEDHDDLLFVLLRALTKVKNDEIVIPFASNIRFELHKDKGYYIKIKYNNEELRQPICSPERCPLEEFIKTLKTQGMFENDHGFFAKCYDK